MTKQLLLFLLTCLTLTFCGTPTEYRDADENYSFKIETIEGKRLWGLVSQPDNKGVRHGSYLPCEYDSIFSAKQTCQMERMFIAVKDGKRYAYDSYWNKFMFENKAITKIRNRKEMYDAYSNSTYGNFYNEAHTVEGIYYFKDLNSRSGNSYFGPFENFFDGEAGYAYKKNGKWGAMRRKLVDLTPDNKFDDRFEDRYIPIFSPIYDGAIEICGPIYYWLVKEGDSWKAIGGESGLEIKRPQSTISMFLQLPILDYKNYKDRGSYYNDRSYNYKRIGGENYGTIWIRNHYHAH